MEVATEATAREKLESAIAALGLSVESVFVPFSASRNAGEKHRTLNWKVTLKRNGREIVTTDYSAGVAHCPAYKRLKMGGYGRETMEQREALNFETEKGKAWRNSRLGIGGAPILPDSVDVIWGLSQDSNVLDSGGFESWAADYGYDADSRKAESIYQTCLELALKLRGAIGEAGLESLREAGSDY